MGRIGLQHYGSFDFFEVPVSGDDFQAVCHCGCQDYCVDHSEILISFRTVTLTNYTHKINGLHENDFILAAKIGKISG